MTSFINILEKISEFGGTKRDITFLVLGGISLLLSLFLSASLPFNIAWIAVILCGIPILLEAVIGLITAFDIRADVLVSIALIASLIIGQVFAAGEVAFIMQLGGLLEELTVARARSGIEKLVHLTPRTARLLSEGEERIIPAEDVQVGDTIKVLPGESVPVDGIILSGETSVNQAVMTGESLPVDKTAGDPVSSGTVNQFGAFTMRAEKVGEDSSIQRMIRLVQSADAGKAKIVGIADRWATWIVVIALSAAVLTGLISGEITRAVTILVVFCPCSLVLATPTAIMAAIGNATKHGFLVKEGDALERLAKVDRITFDKTGTLTKGTPKVLCVRPVNDTVPENTLYRYAASAEALSEHPLGKAVLSCYKETCSDALLPAEAFTMTPGKGIRAMVDGKQIFAGNETLLSEQGMTVPDELSMEAAAHAEKGESVIYVAADGSVLGFLALGDTLRGNSINMIDALVQYGIRPVLLTGDRNNAAAAMGSRLHIEEVHGECLPEDKLTWIETYEKEEHKVCMIGDGINDAPALKKASVGIAMGGVGSDIAVDAADIALIDDKVEELPHLIGLSKRMMTTITINLSLSMTLNIVAVILAITGILNPVVGALVHNAGSVVVIIHSAFLLRFKESQRNASEDDFHHKDHEAGSQSHHDETLLPDSQ